MIQTQTEFLQKCCMSKNKSDVGAFSFPTWQCFFGTSEIVALVENIKPAIKAGI